MNNLYDMDEHELRLLDAALDCLPIAPLPPHFVGQVMAQIGRYPRPFRPEPFKLQFLDLALPAFFTVFASVIFVLLGWLGGEFQIEWLPALQTQGQQAVASLAANQWVVWGSLILVGEVIMGILLGVMLGQEQWGEFAGVQGSK